MNKISTAKAGQMMKMAAENLRALSEEVVSVAAERDAIKAERDELQEKVASFELDKRVEKLAHAMEAKNLNAGLSFEEKVEQLRNHENLDAVEEAVNMQPSQMKLASVVDGDQVQVEGGSDTAADNFVNALLSED